MPSIFALADQCFKGRLKSSILRGAHRAIIRLKDRVPNTGVFLVVGAPHGKDEHCTARVFEGADKGQRYMGAVHFSVDNQREPTFRNGKYARRNWRGTSFFHHQHRCELWDSRFGNGDVEGITSVKGIDDVEGSMAAKGIDDVEGTAATKGMTEDIAGKSPVQN